MIEDNKPLSILGVIIWLIAATFFMYEFFLRMVAGTFSHSIILDLHLNGETFALIAAAYYITYGLMQIPVGMLADRFGVKSLMVFATLMCALSTYLFAHADGFWTALASRLLMGFGSSFAFVCLLVIASSWFPQRFFGFIAGVSQFIGTMGPLLSAGPLKSYLHASGATWREALTMVGVIGIALSVLSLLLVKTRGTEKGKVLFLSRTEPALQRLKKLLGNSQAWMVAIFSATIYISIALLGSTWGIDYLETRALTPTQAGYAMSSAWLGYAIGCPLLGALSDVLKNRKIFLITSAALGLVATSFLIYEPFHHSWVYDILLFGLGVAASGQNLGFATIGEHTSSDIRASAMGLNNGMVTSSAAILPLVTGYIIDAVTHGHAASATAKQFAVALTLMPVMFLIATLVAAFGIKETYAKPQKEVNILSVE